MIKTEKRFWLNMYQVRYLPTRGNYLKMFTFSIGNLGIMLSNKNPIIQLYKLI